MSSWLERLRMQQIHDPKLAMDMNNYDMNDNQVGIEMGATDMPERSGPILTGTGEYDYGPEPTGMAAYKPQTEATDRFNDLISHYPERQSPSFLRTVAASLSAFGAGGPQAAQGVMDEPNIRAMTDWKNQIAPAQQAANLERQENVNARTLAYNTEQTRLGQERIDKKAEQDEAMNKIRNKNADIRELKAKGWTLVKTKGGNVQMMDPVTHTVHDMGIPLGSLDDVTKLSLEYGYKIGAQENKADIDAEAMRQRYENMWTLRDKPQARYGAGGGTGAGAGGRSGMSPAQVATDRVNRAQFLSTEHPEYAQYITVEPGGRIKIKEPWKEGDWAARGRPSPQDYEKMTQFIMGDEPSGNLRDSTYGGGGGSRSGYPTVNPQQNPFAVNDEVEGTETGPENEFNELGGVSFDQRSAPSPSSAPTYRGNPKFAGEPRVDVIGPDGQTHSVPQSQLERAINKEGYKMSPSYNPKGGAAPAPAPTPPPSAPMFNPRPEYSQPQNRPGGINKQVSELNRYKPGDKMNAYTGAVVFSPDGKKYRVPLNEVEQLVSEGYNVTDFDPSDTSIPILMARR